MGNVTVPWIGVSNMFAKPFRSGFRQQGIDIETREHAIPGVVSVRQNTYPLVLMDAYFAPGEVEVHQDLGIPFGEIMRRDEEDMYYEVAFETIRQIRSFGIWTPIVVADSCGIKPEFARTGCLRVGSRKIDYVNISGSEYMARELVGRVMRHL